MSRRDHFLYFSRNRRIYYFRKSRAKFNEEAVEWNTSVEQVNLLQDSDNNKVINEGSIQKKKKKKKNGRKK